MQILMLVTGNCPYEICNGKKYTGILCQKGYTCTRTIIKSSDCIACAIGKLKSYVVIKVI